VVEKVVEKIIRVPVLTTADTEKISLALAAASAVENLWTKFSGEVVALKKALPNANRALDKVQSYKEPVIETILKKEAERINRAPLPQPGPARPGRPPGPTEPVVSHTSDTDDGDTPSGGAKRMLLVLGQQYALDQRVLSKKQLAT